MRLVHHFITLLLLLATAAYAQETITVQPQDTGEALVNPQMGWTFHFYSNIIKNYGSQLEPSDTLDDFPGLSVVYLRLPWSYIEPEEGQFEWSIVDAPAQRWIAKGKQVAFRFTCSESWTRYATPKWVEEAGAKGYNFSPGKLQEDGPYWEPDYGDPVFLEKLENFLEAAARRYDGNPNVAFIDVGSFGVWGEGHTFASTQKKFPVEVLKKHIDLHTQHFKHTLLAINDDFASQEESKEIPSHEKIQQSESVRYAQEQGLALRDDSILVQAPPKAYFHAAMAQPFWPKVPVILECEHSGSSRDRGRWGDGSQYLQAVEDYHAAYAGIHWWPREFLQEQRELIDAINKRLGYRLFPQEISWPQVVAKEGKVILRSRWRNSGVTPCYPGGYVAYTLKDGNDGIVAVFVDEAFNVMELQVGAPNEAPMREIISEFAFAQNVKPGMYDLFVSVGQRDGTPVIALPIDGNDGQKRYKLGQVEVKQ